MRRLTLALALATPLVASLVAFGACSTSQEASPTPPPIPEASTLADATVGDVLDRPDVVAPNCTPIDIPPGTGAKFCDLPGADAPGLTVPPEFCVREFTTTPVKEARVLRFAPNGDLFVAAPSQFTPGGASDGPGAILVLPDDDGDGRADSNQPFTGLSPRNNSQCNTLEADPANMACVHGLVFADGYLYFTRSDEVRRFAYAPGARTAPATSELVATLAGASIPDVRWTHTLELLKDGSLFVSRGRMDTATCSKEEMTRGAVFTLHIEKTATMPLVPELMADGFRNPMYLRCSPSSCGECYASELSGDNWDGVGGHEKLALLNTKGEKWGYPCCVARNVAAPGMAGEDCTNVGVDLATIPLHDTPFGFDFERGRFPGPYTHGVFAALHGVRTSFGGSGVVWLPTDPKSLRPTGTSKMFVNGFGSALGGRASDVTFAPDGRMFIADDTAGKIYWVAPRTLAKPK